MYLFFFVILFFILAQKTLKYKKFKGYLGEKYIQFLLFYSFDKNYKIINNITLNDFLGSTTQIDHIILSPYGIFVLETKNYGGLIYANKYDKKWVQNINSKDYYFQNPIHQNYKHIKVLEKLLTNHINLNKIYSLVIFSKRSSFVSNLPNGVYQGYSWIKFIKNHKHIYLSKKDLEQINQCIISAKLPSNLFTHRKHINNIKCHLDNLKN